MASRLPSDSVPATPSRRCGVLLCNLGTPDAPTTQAVRRYLAEFLSDPRVVELPPVLWQPLLHGLVLRTRPRQSAAKYASIWSGQGSPLLHWTLRQADGLQQALQARGLDVVVRAAMRYGHPAMGDSIDALRTRFQVDRILVLPAYPHYSGTTTASVIDRICSWSQEVRHVPEWRFVNQFHDDPAYIAALAAKVQAHWAMHGRGQMLLLSYHGIPVRAVRRGDPYAEQCARTTALLADALQLGPDRIRMSFQSRFGKAEWLQPYTQRTLEALARQGVRQLDVMCPGFVADCLETLEEIAIEGQAAFQAAGGQTMRYIPCLNDDERWIEALADIAQRNLAGWCNSSTAPVLATA